MIITDNKVLTDIYPFIRACLVNMAKEEGVELYLDYKINANTVFDAYLPRGLEIFAIRHRQACVLIFDGELDGLDLFLQNIYFSLNADLPIYVITKFEGFDMRHYKDYHDVYIYGKSFIDKLIYNNPISFLNYLLGKKDVELKVINRDSNRRIPDEFSSYEIKLSSIGTQTYIISEETPNLISNENESLFKTFLNSKDAMPSNNKCALFIGNGVSIPFGADSWNKLIDNILDYLEPFFIDKKESVKKFLSDSSYAISSFVQSTLYDSKLKAQYDEALYHCVYRKVNELMFKEDTMVRAIALGKDKYFNLPILTYNYDTFVEHQYSLETGKRLVNIIPSRELSIPSNAVVHLHGYIDYYSHNTKNIILTDKEYFDAYLDSPLKPTKSVQINILKNYNCLFVGSSMSDLFQMSIITDIKKKDKRGKWCCFALVCFKDLSLNEKIHLIRYYRSKGIYLITVDSFADLPSKLGELFGLRF